MNELFSIKNKQFNDNNTYDSKDIEVLEGLEPVRRRPGMYIGGTDENSLHHLVNEVFDNAMDEAVAGFASRIEIKLDVDNLVKITDNGRGIPVDPHPKFPDKSALEVIMTILHSGGKLSNKAYNTSGGLHGVGLSVVNALSDYLEVEIVRNKQLYKQLYSKGNPTTDLQNIGSINNRRGTSISFIPDKEIFGNQKFKPNKLYKLAKSKAYLYKGVEIRWSCDPSLIVNGDETPQQEIIHFPEGLKSFLLTQLQEYNTVIENIFTGSVEDPKTKSRFEWAVTWLLDGELSIKSYCNTIYTKDGGTHENGFKNLLVKGLKSFGEMIGNKKSSLITSEDVLDGTTGILSIFIKNPHFQGQTKDKLVSSEVAKLVENNIKDYFDHWLSDNKKESEALLNFIIEKAEERKRKKTFKETNRKNILQRIRLPGKLADCSRRMPKGTELFIVEGDSAGGSAKQARNRDYQAILPLRGKILNVANNTKDKILANQELSDLELALGCGTLSNYQEDKLRYEKIIIMTDADVDGAHIASLLMTYFFIQMPKLIENGHLYLAKPPLYRVNYKNKVYYPSNDKEKDKLLKKIDNRAKVEIGRFKGLGEMTASQLKETTMDPATRTLLKIILPVNIENSKNKVEDLMGKKPELRFRFIQEEALKQGSNVIKNLDV